MEISPGKVAIWGSFERAKRQAISLVFGQHRFIERDALLFVRRMLYPKHSDNTGSDWDVILIISRAQARLNPRVFTRPKMLRNFWKKLGLMQNPLYPWRMEKFKVHLFAPENRWIFESCLWFQDAPCLTFLTNFLDHLFTQFRRSNRWMEFTEDECLGSPFGMKVA